MGRELRHGLILFRRDALIVIVLALEIGCGVGPRDGLGLSGGLRSRAAGESAGSGAGAAL